MVAPLNIDAKDPMPLHAQIERAIRFAIATGRLGAGERLPTVRQLAVDLCVNANTVAKVYAGLERAGVVETRRGAGTFVRPAEDAPNLLRARGRATREGERRLRPLAERFLADASALGFPPEEVLEYLEGVIREGV
jgi:GntR family transcriptional regulator